MKTRHLRKPSILFFFPPSKSLDNVKVCGFYNFVLSKHNNKKQTNQDEVRNFSTKKMLSPG